MNKELNILAAKAFEHVRSTMSDHYGDRWKATVEEHRPFIEGIMKRDGHENPLKAIIPICKKIKDEGRCHHTILAVACELCKELHDKEQAQLDKARQN